MGWYCNLVMGAEDFNGWLWWCLMSQCRDMGHPKFKQEMGPRLTLAEAEYGVWGVGLFEGGDFFGR